jgi:hypothetical protein
VRKRLTDADKWQDSWFMDLPNEGKLLWLYFLDHCSLCGVFDVSYKLINFNLNSKNINKAYIDKYFKNKITWLEENKFLINNFLKFQYKNGVLNEKYNPHKAVLNDLSRNNLSLNEVLNKTKLSLHGRLHIYKDQDQDQDQDQVETKKKKESKKFIKPELEEVEEFVKSQGYSFDVFKFYAYYESNGWKVGKNPMKCWKSACVTWERNITGV